MSRTTLEIVKDHSLLCIYEVGFFDFPRYLNLLCTQSIAKYALTALISDWLSALTMNEWINEWMNPFFKNAANEE